MHPAYFKDGTFEGIKLSRIKADGPFNGLKDGTVCYEVNGAAMTGVEQLPKAVTTLEEGATCVTCRTPDGEKVTRCF